MVRFLIQSGWKTVFSCAGHRETGGRAQVLYSWGAEVDRHAGGKPYVVVALGRRSSHRRWSTAAAAVFSLLMEGFGPLKAFELAGAEKSNQYIRSEFPGQRHFLMIVFQSRAAARARRCP